MSNTFSRGKRFNRFTILTLAFGLALPPLAGAQTGRDREEGLGDRVRRLSEIAAQKLEDEVKNSLDEANRTGPRDPARAAARLKKTLARLQDDDALTESRRNVLIRKVERGIRTWSAEAARVSRDLAARRDNLDRRDQGRIDQDESRRGQADRAEKLIDSTRRTIDESRRLRRERNAGTSGALTSVERSSIPIEGEVKFPADWKKRIANRKSGPQLTKKEAAILKILNSTISVDFKDQKFQDVISYLEDKTGQTIFLDKESLKDKDIDYETPVTLKARKVVVRSLLKKLLNDFGLTYIIKDEVIQVVTAEKARKSMITRVYNVSDLVTANVDQRLLPGLQKLVILENAKQLIGLIKSQVEPDSWVNPDSETGGSGTISFNLATMSLVIKQSAEVHFALRSSLYGG